MPSSRLQLAQQLEDLRLDGDVERRRRLVGDQQLGLAGERHGDHHPLAHAARELVRVVVAAPLAASGMPTELEQLDAPRAPACARRSERCSRSGSAIWRPTGSTGFSDVIGSWKIIAIRAPRTCRIAARAGSCSSVPSKRIGRRRSGPGGSSSRMIESAVDALAAARLADDAERLAAVDVEDTPSTARTTPSRVGKRCAGRRPRAGAPLSWKARGGHAFFAIWFANGRSTKFVNVPIVLSEIPSNCLLKANWPFVRTIGTDGRSVARMSPIWK